MTYSGYETANNHSIFDGLLSYASGVGAESSSQSKNFMDKEFIQRAANSKPWGDHGGSDVPLFATGPLSLIFSSTIDQTYIPHAIAFAMCIFRYKDRCVHQQYQQQPQKPRYMKEIYDRLRHTSATTTSTTTPAPPPTLRQIEATNKAVTNAVFKKIEENTSSPIYSLEYSPNRMYEKPNSVASHAVFCGSAKKLTILGNFIILFIKIHF